MATYIVIKIVTFKVIYSQPVDDGAVRHLIFKTDMLTT